METHRALAPLARFHVRVGARLAMRAAAPLAGLPLVAAILQQDPNASVRAMAAWLLGPAGGAGAGLALGVVALTTAGWAAPRVTAGLDGWARHLPVAEATHRRAALVAMATALTPLVIGLLVLAPAAASQPGGFAPLRLVALPLVAVAAAVAAWPGERPWASRTLALVALVVLARPSGPGIPVAVLLLVAADRFAGPLAAATPMRRAAFPPLPLPVLVAARALGSSPLISSLLALLPVGAMTLFRVNNDLTPDVATGASRLGAGLGITLLLTALAERLPERRPPWPWARSLPSGARRRAAEDAIVLAIPGLLPLGVTACVDAAAALAVLASLPYLAFRAAGAVRRGTRASAGAAAPFLVEAALLAGGMALLPWLGVVALAAAPLAWRTAAEHDRRQKVSRWDALHHRVVGDPLSWSAR